ncbi:MAG: complex I NDUFA9 subunit family protein [Sphingomonadales bacterium]
MTSTATTARTMRGQLITVFGGSGFIGRNLVRHLAERGARVRVAVRNPDKALFLKPLGDVGQIQIVQANVRHEGSVVAAVGNADSVINLVGILFESGKQKFSGIQAEGAGVVARAAAAAGTRRLIQVSAIGADADSPSAYARSKAVGEDAVRAAFPDATILRPSIVFGPDDNFFNRFAGLARISPIVPLIGADTRFQPVYVGDVADAITAALENSSARGQTYELGGPTVYTFRELMELTLREIGAKRLLVPVPFVLAKVKAAFLQLLPNPPLTVDQVRLLQSDNVVGNGIPGLADLGVTPTPAEVILPRYLYRFRKHGQFS